MPSDRDQLEIQKAALRASLRAQLAEVSDAERQPASVEVRERLAAQRVWQSARSVLVYAALPDELDLWPLAVVALKDGREVALPRFNPATREYEAALVRETAHSLEPGRFGILEPGPACPAYALNRLDLVLVPGVGFDSDGHRLGRGKGFYDRILCQVHGLRCGVAMDRQVLPAIPTGPEDVSVDCIVTPTRWLWCRRAAA